MIQENSPATEAVHVVVEANGQALPVEYMVLSITVHTQEGQPAEANIVLAESLGADAFSPCDSGVLAPGTGVRISAGYGDQPLSPIFEGMVMVNRLALKAVSGAQFIATCESEVAESLPESAASPVLSLVAGENIFQAEIATDSAEAQPESIWGTVICPGTAAASLGDTVQLAGLGSRFSQHLLVAGLTHTIEEGVWRTAFLLG